ncbi:MAG TPA: polyprenol monophosphomannose synthase [Terracidiphilus sp.]|jgi:dolichol-phosphate mannosyltransferase|nr:polyprenol monophosphomannose synthase [Terracidiphilus sp.]
MLRQEKLALVIPTLREAQCLEMLLGRVRAVLSGLAIPFEILVVDDDSRDGTEELVTAMAAEDARVRLLVRRGERGLAGAILHGWQNTDASILGAIDADMQHPPELLAKLLPEMAKGQDAAVASRFARGGGMTEWNPLRKLLSAISIGVTVPLQRSGMRVKDPLSGYFLVRRCCVENILFRPTGFKLLLEILVRGRVGTVSEIPFAFGRRAGGRSKVSLGVAWDYLRLLARLYRARWRRVRVAPGFPAD